VAGAVIDLEMKDREIREVLGRIQRRMDDLAPAMRILGNIVRTSVIRNFEAGGRPRWKPLSPVTLAGRKGGKILMRQGFAGGLAGSINVRAEKDRAIVGTNKAYAAVHQFGARKGSFGTFTFRVREHMRKLAGKHIKVREHTRTMSLPWGDIPARPYLMVQDEDWVEMREALQEYITGGKR